jgi:hypothetical protein
MSFEAPNKMSMIGTGNLSSVNLFEKRNISPESVVFLNRMIRLHANDMSQVHAKRS